MKFSIITPCYNSEKYLTEMIESVLQQSYKNFELIIVNDGSTDNSSRIIKHYQSMDSRIISIDQENSGKPSIARNEGIKKATGDIFTFLDADDIYTPERLELIINAFRVNTTTNVVIHDYNRISEKGKKLTNGIVAEKWQKQQMYNFFDEIEDKLYQSTCELYLAFFTTFFMIHTSSIAFKSQAYPAQYILFDESLTYYEDLLKWCELVVNQNVIYIPLVLSSYRDTPGGLISKSKDFDMAGIDFYQNQLNKPLIPLPNEIKKAIKKSLTIEYKNSLYSVSGEGALKYTLKLSLELLKIDYTFKNLKVVIKNLLLSLKNKI